MPGGLKYQPIRGVPLKDDFDEWLARVVCFAFSIPPTAFSKQTNRATAESAQDSATVEGLQPLLVWLKSLIDRIIGQVLGCDDLEFAWSDRTAPDLQTQATIAAAYVGAGIKTRNEVRAELGLDPIAGGDALTTAMPAAVLPGGFAKFNPHWPTQPRHQGQWATDGSSAASARLILAGGPEEEAETPGEERIESFNEMPSYLQHTILSVQDPDLRGRLMDDQDLAETYYQYGQTAQRLRQTDPNNPLLDTIHVTGWLPTDEDLAELQAAVQASRSAPNRPTWQESEDDVGRDLGPGAKPQISFKNGVEVPRGTPGSVRPDYIQGDIASFEVKNYNIETNAAGLIRNVSDQAIQRAQHLPVGIQQRVIIDIRGQSVSESRQEEILESIVSRAKDRRYLRLDQLDPASKALEQVSGVLSVTRTKDIDWASIHWNPASTKLTLSAPTVDHVLDRYLKGARKRIDGARSFEKRFGVYQPVMTIISDLPRFLIDEHRPLAEYDALEGEPIWLRP